MRRWIKMLAVAAPLGAVMVVTQLGVWPALGDAAPLRAEPHTSVGSVTVDGKYRVISRDSVVVTRPGRAGQPLGPAVRFTLISMDPSPYGSCTIIVTDHDPKKVNNHAEGYSSIETSAGCQTVTWKHAMYEWLPSDGGSYTWVRKSQLYQHDVRPGGFDHDLRSPACVSSLYHNWKNDTNYTSGATATLACA